MVVVNYTKNRVALLLGGSIAEEPSYMAIGVGSSTVLTSNTTLLSGTDVQSVTSSSYPASTKIKWQFDWNSIELSGTQLAEFGMMQSGTSATGSIWSRTVLPSLTFDGTNELRIEETWEVY